MAPVLEGANMSNIHMNVDEVNLLGATCDSNTLWTNEEAAAQCHYVD